jgi:hypothetical protein
MDGVWMKEIFVLLSGYFFLLEYVMYNLKRKKILWNMVCIIWKKIKIKINSICRFASIMFMFQNVDHCINK